ncbi:MAG: RelA/SpoT family protein [Pseudomonadota bacterium]
MHEIVEIKFTELLDKVSAYASESELDDLREAFDLSKKIFADRRWVNGETYIVHPLDVAVMLAGMRQDIPSLAAALLHDCDRHGQDVAQGIGEETRGLLMGYGRLREIDDRSQSLEQSDNLRRMIINEARDLRTLILYLVDHTQIMINLDHFTKLEKGRILEKSVKVYAPLSGKLGIHRVKSRLEDIGFRHTNPDDYDGVMGALSETKNEREKYISRITGLLGAMCRDRGIETDVFGRVKHSYSIYQKMKRQSVTMDGIYDIIAFRIIVDSEQQCWEVLGIIHGRWSPIPGRFRDYLSVPKKNGYRSLHTSVTGPGNKRIEIQIRTREMHRVAEEGIAAHWRYKAKGKKRISPIEEKQLKWITSSLEEDGEERGGEEIFSSEIYVFTPAGDVIALPKGATPLDFAYAIHTNIGHRCTAALVNGNMAALSHELASGDLVKVVTKPGQHPRKDWLDMAATTRAKTKIRSYLNAILRKEQIEKGRDILEKFLRDKSMSLHKMEKKGKLGKVAEEIRSPGMNEVYIRIASGKVALEEIYEILKPPVEKEEAREEDEIDERMFEGIRRDSGEIRIGDIGNLLVKFAGCCKPLPGDKVTGFITRGRGITIHRANCPNLLAGDSERRVSISWNIAQGVKSKAGIRVITEDVPGILAKLTQFIASKGINVTAARSEKKSDGSVVNLFTFEISNTSELVSLIRALERVTGVQDIERV